MRRPVESVHRRSVFSLEPLAVVTLLLSMSSVLGAPAHASQTEYVVGAQDVLMINLWDQTDLSGRFSVEADGTFTFPLIGRVKAGGLTLRELEDELRRRLKEGHFFKNPQLSVAVEQYRSQRVFIVGEVRQPGTYPLTGDMSLIEALARAGATTDSAGAEAIIVRPPAGRPTSGPVLPDQGQAVERVDLKSLQRGAAMLKVPLRDGDTIFIPRAETVYVYGQVRTPGAYPVPKDATVLQVLSLAGGVTDRGSTARLKILRVVDGTKREIKVKLGDVVLPGDTIVVPERFF